MSRRLRCYQCGGFVRPSETVMVTLGDRPETPYTREMKIPLADLVCRDPGPHPIGPCCGWYKGPGNLRPRGYHRGWPVVAVARPPIDVSYAAVHYR